jgi:hypothetical protein
LSAVLFSTPYLVPLSARGERSRGHRVAEEHDELAPSYQLRRHLLLMAVGRHIVQTH